jgi:hypothetical protein
MDFEVAKEKMTGTEYGELLRQTSLTAIILERLEAVADRKAITADQSIQLRIRRDLSAAAGDGSPGVCLRYFVWGNAGRRRVVTIRATYRVALNSEVPLTPEFLSIYAHSSADLNVWPYLRELANSLTRRMDLPALTLPLLQNPAVLSPAAKG